MALPLCEKEGEEEEKGRTWILRRSPSRTRRSCASLSRSPSVGARYVLAPSDHLPPDEADPPYMAGDEARRTKARRSGRRKVEREVRWAAQCTGPSVWALAHKQQVRRR